MDRRLRAFASAITTCEKFCRDQTWRVLLRAKGEKPQISPLRFASVEVTSQVWLPSRTAQRESPSALVCLCLSFCHSRRESAFPTRRHRTWE